MNTPFAPALMVSCAAVQHASVPSKLPLLFVIFTTGGPVGGVRAKFCQGTGAQAHSIIIVVVSLEEWSAVSNRFLISTAHDDV